MTTFVLIRHAASEGLGEVLVGRASGIALTEEGRRQAQQLAAEIRHLPFDQLYSSPLQRCCETAEAISALLDRPVQVEQDLVEIDFGSWTRQRFEQLASDSRWQNWNSHRSAARPPRGESMEEAQARIVGALEGWARRGDEQTIVVISHADLIKAAVVHCRGDSLDTILAFEIAPASATVLAWDETRHAVLLTNGSGAALAHLLHPAPTASA